MWIVEVVLNPLVRVLIKYWLDVKGLKSAGKTEAISILPTYSSASEH